MIIIPRNCITPPNTELWRRHLEDLYRLLAKAQHLQKPALVDALIQLIETHEAIGEFRQR